MFYYHIVYDVAAVGCNDAMILDVDAVVRDAARVGGESVVRDAVDDVRSGSSSSSSIQGLA